GFNYPRIGRVPGGLASNGGPPGPARARSAWNKGRRSRRAEQTDRARTGSPLRPPANVAEGRSGRDDGLLQVSLVPGSKLPTSTPPHTVSREIATQCSRSGRPRCQRAPPARASSLPAGSRQIRERPIRVAEASRGDAHPV